MTELACISVGWAYRRVGEVDPVLAENTRWLSGYRHPRCRVEEHARCLLQAFAEPTPLLVGARDVGDPLVVLPTLFHLLWAQVLSVDLSADLLNMASVISRAPGAR
jgi:hypothetical protein